jgi:hypothetical protein
MHCKYNIDISDSQKFINDLNSKSFVEISGENIWSLGYETLPFDDEYEKPEKFPDCCNFHTSIKNKAEEWFEKFPDCCENHKKLIQKYWFLKANYKNIPNKIVTQISFTENFIDKNIEKIDWYKEITDYIEYSIESFGMPNIGGERYISNIRHWILENNPTEYIFPVEKKKSLVEFIDKFTTPTNNGNTDLNLLISTFQKWLKTFPDLIFFVNLKEQLKGKVPINLLLYEPNYNRFSGMTKMKIRTHSELIQILINTTKKLLGLIDTPQLLVDGYITNKSKYQIDILSQQHKIKQNQLLVDYTSHEIKYLKIIKSWLKNEKEYLSELKPLIENSIEMSKKYVTEVKEIFGKPYLKVYLRDKSKNEEIARFIELLQSVKNANVTDNKEKDITVYPAKTFSIEEMKSELDIALDSFFSKGTHDPIFEDVIQKLSFKSYEDILLHIRNYGRNLGKFKNLYEKFDEEGFRDFFLPHLNLISKSLTATGETFNKIGKTDILIQDESGLNVFIAECKLWKGESQLSDAVDQLLDRYVTWHDEKVALIVFNKDMKNFTELLRKAPLSLTKHKNFESFAGATSDNSFRFVFKHPDDENRKIDLELIVFNCV